MARGWHVPFCWTAAVECSATLECGGPAIRQHTCTPLPPAHHRRFCGSNTPPGDQACQYIALPSNATAVHRVAARNALLSM